VIAAGETVSAEVVEYLECLRSHGAILKGAADPSLRSVRVLA
jgi:arginine/lysine/ornithine decarboxylase